MKTAEEIYNDRFHEDDTPDGLYIVPVHEVDLKSEIIAAMEEYKNQSQPIEKETNNPEIPDNPKLMSEIEKAAVCLVDSMTKLNQNYEKSIHLIENMVDCKINEKEALEQEIERLRKLDIERFDHAKELQNNLANERREIERLKEQLEFCSRRVIKYDSRIKELEAQLKEKDEALQYAKNYLTKGGFGRVDCLQKVSKALESSPTEQPEAQNVDDVQWQDIMTTAAGIEPQPEKKKVLMDYDGSEIIFPEEQPQPEKAQEEQSELWDLVYNNYISWYDQEIKLTRLLEDFTITRKHHD